MVQLRLATPADNAALLELFGAVPMSGSLVLSTRRDPDFFALYRMQRGAADCWVGEEEGRLVGMGTVLTRDGWLNGEPATVGYLGDLRARFGASRARGLASFYGDVLRRTAQERRCELFLTAVLASNRAALQALVRRRKGREGQPHYHLLRRFSATSIQFAGKRKPGRGPEVRTARAEDAAPLARFLAEDHRGRAFGYRFDQGELQHRLQHWPGFQLGDTYLAFDAKGEMVGCATAWDPSPVKRFRVEAYRGRMAWMKRGYNALAAVRRYTPLPQPGREFRYFYLCNVSVRGEDPAVFRALLDRVHADFRERGYHFFTVYLEEDDPLRPALKGFFVRELPFHLYVVSQSEKPPELRPGRVGFEMALA